MKISTYDKETNTTKVRDYLQINMGEVSIEINIMYPDKTTSTGVMVESLPIDYSSSHTRLGKMLNKAIADYLTKSDDYVVCGMNKDGSLKWVLNKKY